MIVVVVAAIAASTETEEVDTFAREVFWPARAVSVLFEEVTKLAIEALYAAAIAASTLDDELERLREAACSVVILVPRLPKEVSMVADEPARAAEVLRAVVYCPRTVSKLAEEVERLAELCKLVVIAVPAVLREAVQPATLVPAAVTRLV